MKISAKDCCVLNRGGGSWAFELLAAQLAASLGVDVSRESRRFNYLLLAEDEDWPTWNNVFIPPDSIQTASDKRLLAAVFLEYRVPTPRTLLFDAFEEVRNFVHDHIESKWCLKYPTSCGANGHRLITEESAEPANWPRPFVVQEFVPLKEPEVYRIYCASGELFGWVVRRFPQGVDPSPWVAHARGARYVSLGEAPPGAREAARHSLVATGLWNSFGCVDLLRRQDGRWVVLEVGTDGIFNHVDRDLGDALLEEELRWRVADAFWRAAEEYEGKSGI